MELLPQGIMVNRLPMRVLFYNREVVANINGVHSNEQLDDFLNTNIQQQPKNIENNPKHNAGFLNLNSLQEKDDYMLAGLYSL